MIYTCMMYEWLQKKKVPCNNTVDLLLITDKVLNVCSNKEVDITADSISEQIISSNKISIAM